MANVDTTFNQHKDHGENTASVLAASSKYANNGSAVAWGAVLAGAVATAVFSIMLLILGVGLGLSSVSPWAQYGIAASTFGLSAILWLSFTQIIASGLGGYLTGRLRTKWLNTQTDEVYFRDTAHGFLSWSVATLATAALLTTVIGAIVNGGVQASASVAGKVGAAVTESAVTGGGVTQGANQLNNYLMDALLRKDSQTPAGDATPMQAHTTQAANNPAPELLTILMCAMQSGTLPQEDVTYAAQLISAHTGIAQADSEKRIKDVYSKMRASAENAENMAKVAAETARKFAKYAALWLFVSLLIGAFTASLAATCGGRCRDL